MNRRGVSYDVGRVMYGNWRPVFDPTVVHRELEISKNDLHCNAVRICGRDVHRLMTAAEDALRQGLEVWLSPELWDKSQDETRAYLTKAAAAAEHLRARWPDRLVLVVGGELTLCAKEMTRIATLIRTRHGRTAKPTQVMIDAQTVRGGRAGPTLHEVGGRTGRSAASSSRSSACRSRSRSTRPSPTTCARGGNCSPRRCRNSGPSRRSSPTGAIGASTRWPPRMASISTSRHRRRAPSASPRSRRSTASSTPSRAWATGGGCRAATRDPPRAPALGSKSPRSPTCSRGSAWSPCSPDYRPEPEPNDSPLRDSPRSSSTSARSRWDRSATGRSARAVTRSAGSRRDCETGSRFPRILSTSIVALGIHSSLGRSRKAASTASDSSAGPGMRASKPSRILRKPMSCPSLNRSNRSSALARHPRAWTWSRPRPHWPAVVGASSFTGSDTIHFAIVSVPHGRKAPFGPRHERLATNVTRAMVTSMAPRSADRSVRLIAALVIAGLASGCVVASSAPGSSQAGSSSAPAATGPDVSILASAKTSSSPGQGIVTWVDRPAAEYVDPTPRPYPTDARPCGAKDLKVSAGELGLAMGNTNLPVDFANASDSVSYTH